MQADSTRFAGGLWLVVIGIFMGLGFAGGYLVAANQTSTAFKKQEKEWSVKSKAFVSQNNKQTAELASAKEQLTRKEGELAERLKKETAAVRELRELQATLESEREENASRMAELKAHLDIDRRQQGLVQQFLKAKQGFTNIKIELAAGHFKGLRESSGFQILSAAFETVEEKK
ncbi:hypothetical protein DES53_10834 [Roseimicrobium gellanilyticum]|uniref:Uncharacterized protein n=1 Tax=Roseimicrobium gellanilyticum TaxID=748857 RepID=A0A366HFT6_9BACT|nr:hypothetical protein [Roseimicrobium gellanilyticum]RBP40328.1 hypothetical protein DES53_10834 [Roseimicrobium gellanilyticum]